MPPARPSEPHRAFPRPQRCRSSNLPPRAPARPHTAAAPRARLRYLSAMGRPRAALGWAGLGSAGPGWTQPASAPHRAPRPASPAQRAQWEGTGGAGRGGAAPRARAEGAKRRAAARAAGPVRGRGLRPEGPGGAVRSNHLAVSRARCSFPLYQALSHPRPHLAEWCGGTK